MIVLAIGVGVALVVGSVIAVSRHRRRDREHAARCDRMRDAVARLAPDRGEA